MPTVRQYRLEALRDLPLQTSNAFVLCYETASLNTMAPKAVTRFCACGCGKPAKKNIVKGRNKGWCKYAKGHEPKPPLCDKEVRAKALASRKRRLDREIPIGTRRVVNKKGKLYYEIKVAGGGKWPLEHRHIMATRLGRKLRRNEHVHHRDDNGLNNGLHADGQDNLQLLSASKHMSLTNLNAQRVTCACTCPHCGAKLRHFKKLKTRTRR